MKVHSAKIIAGTKFYDAAQRAGIQIHKSGEYGEPEYDGKDFVSWEGWYYTHTAIGESADVYESREDAAKAALDALAAWLAGVLK